MNQAQKRPKPFNDQEILDMEPKTKCPKLSEIQHLFDDFVAKKAEADQAESLWREARNGIEFIHTPKAKEQDIA